MSSRPKRLVFILIFIISLYLIFWHFPLHSLDALKTPTQDPNYSDQNWYLFFANDLATSSSISLDDLNASWSTFGILGYLYLGKMIFQTEFFYVLLNPVLFLFGWLILIKNLKMNLLIRKDGLLLLSLFPSMLLVLSTPGKEFLAIFGTLFFFNGCTYHFTQTKNSLSALYIILGLFIVGLNRPHEAAVLIISLIVYKSMTSHHRLRALLLSIPILLIGLSSLKEIEIFISFTDQLKMYEGSSWNLSSKDISPSLAWFASKLNSDNLFIHSLLGIPRVIVVFCAPLITSFTNLANRANVDIGFDYYVFRNLSSTLRTVDIVATIWIIKFSLTNFKRKRLSPNAEVLVKFLAFNVLTSYYFIVYFGIVEKSRYFIQFGYIWLLIYLLLESNQERDKSFYK